MVDRDAFIAAIKDDWLNFDLRRVFSDWLEENGELKEALRQRDYQKEIDRANQWISEFAVRIDQTVPRLMQAAQKWVTGQRHTYDNSEGYKDVPSSEFEIFWDMYEILTGVVPPNAQWDPEGEYGKPCFYTCSC